MASASRTVVSNDSWCTMEKLPCHSRPLSAPASPSSQSTCSTSKLDSGATSPIVVVSPEGRQDATSEFLWVSTSFKVQITQFSHTSTPCTTIDAEHYWPFLHNGFVAQHHHICIKTAWVLALTVAAILCCRQQHKKSSGVTCWIPEVNCCPDGASWSCPEPGAMFRHWHKYCLVGWHACQVQSRQASSGSEGYGLQIDAGLWETVDRFKSAALGHCSCRSQLVGRSHSKL